MGLLKILRLSWPSLLAEFVGTLILIFLCVGGGLNWDFVGVTDLQLGFSNGLTVATLVQIFGHVSQCHINPIVTFTMLLFKRMDKTLAVLYVICQLAGGAVGAALLKSLTPVEVRGGMGIVLPNVGVGQALGTEMVITFVLVLVVFGVSDEQREDIKGSVPLAVGLTVMACTLVGNGYSGACMNPARSFGPAIVAWKWTHHWIYWVGPGLGGIIAATLYHTVFRINPKVKQGSRSWSISNKLESNNNQELQSQNANCLDINI